MPGGARSDPPKTGVLLPDSVTYVQLLAKTTPALYSNTNYTSSNAR